MIAVIVLILFSIIVTTIITKVVLDSMDNYNCEHEWSPWVIGSRKNYYRGKVNLPIDYDGIYTHYLHRYCTLCHEEETTTTASEYGATQWRTQKYFNQHKIIKEKTDKIAELEQENERLDNLLTKMSLGEKVSRGRTGVK